MNRINLSSRTMRTWQSTVPYVLGYDHEDDPSATVMEDLERKVMASLGYPDPYAITMSTERGAPSQRSWLERLIPSLSGEPATRAELVEMLRDAEDRNLVDPDVLGMLKAFCNRRASSEGHYGAPSSDGFRREEDESTPTVRRSSLRGIRAFLSLMMTATMCRGCCSPKTCWDTLQLINRSRSIFAMRCGP